jgi:hypothetical protein
MYNVDGKQYYGEHITKMVAATGAWVAGAALGDIQIDRDLLITNVRLQAHVVHQATTGAALSDGAKRSLQGLRIVGDSKTFLGLVGGAIANQQGRLLSHLNRYDTGTGGLGEYVIVGGALTDQMYHFHPGLLNPRDSFDMSCVIPARALTNLVAQIQCPAATAMDATGGAAITAITYSIEIDGVQGVPAGRGMFYPGAYVQSVPHTVALATLPGLELDIPTGGYLKRIVMMMDDNTGVNALRSDAQVTFAQIRVTSDSKTILAQNMLNLKYKNAIRYAVHGDDQPAAPGAVTLAPAFNGSVGLPVGFGIIDLRDYFDPILGLNLTQANQGFWKLGLATAVATGTTFILWDIVYPMDPAWVGK